MSACPPPQTILLVEDDSVAAEVLCEALGLLWHGIGAGLRHCLTLAEARGVLAHQTPDLVIADLKLPDSAPEETLHALVTLLPPTVPLIIISGYVTSYEGYAMLTQGADAFLPKGHDIYTSLQQIGAVWLAAYGRQVRARGAA